MWNKEIKIERSQFIGNKGGSSASSSYNGALYTKRSLNNYIADCRFENNTAGFVGGIYIYGNEDVNCSNKIERSMFVGNKGISRTGAIYVKYYYNSNISDSNFTRNEGGKATALRFYGSSSKYINRTIIERCNFTSNIFKGTYATTLI